MTPHAQPDRRGGVRGGPLDETTALTNNRRTSVRKLVAVALCLLVQGAALTGPLVHAHPDDGATTHHSGRTVHTHWGGHTDSPHHSNAPAFDTPDHDRALFLNAFVATTAVIPLAPVVIQASFELPVPAERAAYRGIEVVRSHDPPSDTRQSPRAPPAFLSLI